MRWSEALVFTLLAAGVHAGVWTLSPVRDGMVAAGGGGAAEVTVAAASAAQAAMVAEWQRPPEVAAEPAAFPVPDNAMQAPEAHTTPRVDRPARSSFDAPRLATMPPAMTSPQVDTTPAPPQEIDQQADRTRPKARPERITAQATAQQPERKAKGAAREAQQGRGGSNRLQSQDSRQTNALRASWGAQIHAKVQRSLIYPRSARGTGTAKLALKVAPNGKLRGLSLIRSSGDPQLDKAAFDAVKRAGRFAKAPAGLSEASYAFSLSLTFSR